MHDVYKNQVVRFYATKKFFGGWLLQFNIISIPVRGCSLLKLTIIIIILIWWLLVSLK